MLDLDSARKIPPGIWMFAAGAAAAIHVGCVVVALAYMQPEEDDDTLGAPAIEISLERVAPKFEATDLPPGPEATAAAPEMVEQKAVTEKTELSTAVPTDTEDPDRLVAPDPTQNPRDEPTVRTVQTSPSQESVPTEATAMPSSESVREATH